MNTKRSYLDGLVQIGVRRDGSPVWSIAGGAGDDDAPEVEAAELSFTVPEDLSELDDEALEELHTQALEAFEELREQAEDLDESGMATLEAIADAITRITDEQGTRVTAREERAARADELASRIRPPAEDDDGEVEETTETEEAPAAEDEVEEPAAEDEEAVAAAARGPITINIQGVRRRQNTEIEQPARKESDVRSTMVAADGTPGITAGVELDIPHLADVLSARLEGVTTSAYHDAYRSGERIQTRLPAALIRREVPEELRVSRPLDTQSVVAAATERWKSEMRAGTFGDQLTASAWCAPSTPIYDICELETTDGIISAPSIVVDRGGVLSTTGPDFRDFFAGGVGFCFSHDELEAQDPPGSGPKPCATVECPEFEDTRLGVCGTCLRAGLLQNRAYPELVQRTIRGSLVAHAHEVAGTHITAMVAGSDVVNMPADQAGALAPILTSIELQTEHFRYVNRSSESELLEAVFPRWTRGLIRSDLSRRLGVNMLEVDNSTINQWFSSRGVQAQFVVNFDDLTGDAADFTAWPDTVPFLLYSPGTWVFGGADVIRLDTLFDSELLAANDFTALFMEEGLLTLKTCPDSRIVNVPVCADGATHGGIDIDCDGSVVDAGGA